MKNLSTRASLLLSFGTLLLLLVGVAAVSLVGLMQSNQRMQNFVRVDAEQMKFANDVLDGANARAIAARNLVLTTTEAARAAEKNAVDAANKKLADSVQALSTQAMKSGGEAATLIAAIQKAEAAYGPVAQDIVAKAMAGQRELAISKINDECRPLLAALLKAADSYLAYADKAAHESANEAAASAQWIQYTVAGALALSVLVSMVLTYWVTRRIISALGAEPAELHRVAEAVAQGDLSRQIDVREGDRHSVLAGLKLMRERLAESVSSVRRNAEGVAIAATQIAQGNQDLSGRTEQQAAALEETASSMEELGSTVKQNADNARQASQLAMSASSVAVQGGDVVAQVVETMKGINDSSKKIADIITVIDGIAFQTNILALNAAVEAARAGEQGRGFAVVAGEVRSLAQRSAEAAKEIKSLITTSVERVGQGSELVDRAGRTMQEVVASIKRVTDIMGEISAASAEQSAGVAQVGQAVTQMDQATQQNAALVEQSAAAAESLKVQAQQLVHAVAAFHLDAADGGLSSWQTEQRQSQAASPRPSTALAVAVHAAGGRAKNRTSSATGSATGSTTGSTAGVVATSALLSAAVAAPAYGTSSDTAPAAAAPAPAAAPALATAGDDDWTTF